MDERALTQTIQELERKLGELERTLHAIGSPEPAGEPRTAPLHAAAGVPEPSPPMRPEPPERPIEPAFAPRRTGFGRIVDESVEAARPSPPAEGLARPPQPAVGIPAPAARTPPPPRAATPSPPSTQRPAAPAPAELLRFRERLERAARDLTHDYDELLGRLSYAAMPTTTGPTISFARGVPSLDIIDVDGTAVGYPRLRAWIADKHGVEPERVLVTNGSLQADAFLFDHLVHAGDEVVVESPTYDRTLLGLRERGAQLHPVALETDGIDTRALAALLEGGARPKLAHVIPNFQNPAGYTLSLRKREELLELAARYDFVVLEDDPYGELRF